MSHKATEAGLQGRLKSLALRLIKVNEATAAFYLPLALQQ